MTTLAVDRDQIVRFVHALFAGLDPWGYVSLRAFRQFPPKGEPDRPLHIEPVRLNTGLEPVIDAAERIAARVSNGGEPAVFAPPICTFTGRKGAKASDVHEAPVLSVEIDQGDVEKIADALSLILDERPTIALHSGSVWANSTTGEPVPKGHLHWRLRTPARGPEQQQMLRRARDIAALLAGADPSGTPPVHPLRWPGTWNRKGERPVMATIIEENTTAIDLAQALAALEDAAQAANLATPRNAPHLAADDLPAELAQLAEWLRFYTTTGLYHWHDWNKVAMAIHRATGGSEAGYQLFRAWSETSRFYNEAGCRARWDAITSCPATWIGARFLRRMAIEHGWSAPETGSGSPPQQEQEQEQEQEPPPDDDATDDDATDDDAPNPEDGADGQDPAAESKTELYGPPTEADVIASLVALDELAYARIRKAKAAQLGVDVPSLNQRVQRARSEATAAEAEARNKAKRLPPLTEAERAALFEHAADLDDEDYELERDDLAEQLSRGRKTKFRLTALGKLRKEIRQARADAEAARLAALRRNQPPPAPVPETPEVTALIAEFNDKYFVIDENGKAIVYAPKKDLDQNREFYERITFADLEKLYLNRSVLTGINENTGEPVYEPVARVWLRHRNRRQFIGGMVFDPSGRKQDEGVYNLWQEFSVKPRAGTWGRLREHTSTIICNGITEHFDYMMDWMADLVQHPEKQGEVAIVLRGKEGTGKGILARALKYLLGQHGFAISNARHLTGNFNAHLRDCVFLFADEALYAGDKAHVGILKSIITEPYLTIEGKYQNAVQSPNRLHIMLASNEDWVVPAGLESRRFFVLDVSDEHANDHAYFAAITDELENGGYEAMLEELRNRIPFGNLRKVPVTDALVDQRTRSLPPHQRWWLDCLMRGYVFRSRLGLEDIFATWLDPISTELLFDSYTEYCRAHHERHPLSRVHFARWFHAIGYPPIRPDGMVVVGEHLTDATASDTTGRIAEIVERDRAPSYKPGDLGAARAAFTKATKLTVAWPDDGPEPAKPAVDLPERV